MAGHGSKLRRLRHARNLSRQDLAIRAGLSVHTIERVERDQPCSHATLYALAAGLGVTLADLTSDQVPA